MELRVVTANLIEKDGKYLLVQEGKESVYGLWNFPAGRLEERITLVDNAIKEAKEETGYKVKIKGLVGVYHDAKKERNTVIFVFASSVVGGKLRTQEGEILDAKWLTLREIKSMEKKLRGRYILIALSDYEKRGLLPSGAVNSKKL